MKNKQVYDLGFVIWIYSLIISSGYLIHNLIVELYSVKIIIFILLWWAISYIMVFYSQHKLMECVKNET